MATLTINKLSTNYLWANQLLKDIGAPTTTNNIQNVMRWMAAENFPTNWFNRDNPLNASLGTDSSNGTGSYPDLSTAAQNTATMIAQGAKGGAIGGQIYSALKNNATSLDFSQAVVDSNWSSSHYGVAVAGAPASAIVPGRQVDYLATIPVPSIISISKAVFPPLSPYSGAGQTVTAVGCASKPDIFGFDGVFGVGKFGITACNFKAWKGGFLVVAGGIVLLVGVSFILSSTKTGQQAIQFGKYAGLVAA